MKNKLSIIITLISIILLIVACKYGIKIGDIRIYSISQLIEKNNGLEETIAKVAKLTSTEYPDNVSKLEESFQFYSLEKKKYKELIGTKNEVDEEIYETKQYDIGYLWKRLGSYAEEEKFSGDQGLEISLNVTKNNVGPNTYDFNFNVSGTYTRISQFIVDIENDSELNFRIHDFKMKSKNATFIVKNVNIDETTISVNSATSEDISTSEDVVTSEDVSNEDTTINE